MYIEDNSVTPLQRIKLRKTHELIKRNPVSKKRKWGFVFIGKEQRGWLLFLVKTTYRKSLVNGLEDTTVGTCIDNAVNFY